MNRNTKIVAGCIVAALIGSAAGRPGSAESQAQGAFTGKYWVLTSFTANPAIDWDMDGAPETDILAKLEPCERDDAMMFRKDNKVLSHQGNISCDEDEEKETEMGEWKYTPATKQLTVMTAGQPSRVYTVVEASAGRLVLSHQIKGRSLLTATYKLK